MKLTTMIILILLGQTVMGGGLVDRQANLLESINVKDVPSKVAVNVVVGEDGDNLEETWSWRRCLTVNMLTLCCLEFM